MNTYSVVPDVIDSEPSGVAKVEYAPGVEMQLGNELTPRAVKDLPSLVQWASSNEELFTLVLIDPDAPSRAEPTFGECLHWLVINITGNDLSTGETLVEYVGSGPPEGTGLHRYILLVYRQQGKLMLPDFKKITKTELSGRISFKIRDFAQKHQLNEPVAGNFYQAQYDDYVPILRALING